MFFVSAQGQRCRKKSRMQLSTKYKCVQLSMLETLTWKHSPVLREEATTAAKMLLKVIHFTDAVKVRDWAGDVLVTVLAEFEAYAPGKFRMHTGVYEAAPESAG